MNAIGAAARRSTCGAALFVALAAIVPAASFAEPVELKLAFFASETADSFRYGIKPFVDAVNTEGQGAVSIKVYPDGALGKSIAEQPQLVSSGAADIAWVVPGQTPYRFPDNEVLEMPGLFRDVREATLVYTRLVTAGALRGYQDFVVVGAFGTAPGIMHSRKPLRSLGDLGGLKIRTNNAIEAEALGRLGAIATVMPAPMLADALSRGAIDATILSPSGLFQFGPPVATHHYLLTTGTAPLVLLMSRKRFDSLPERAQAVIRKHAGENSAAAWIEFYGGSEAAALERIKADPQRTVAEPSQADRATARRVYDEMIESWAAKSAQNARLVETIRAELAAIRSGSR
jgi:TRAP-type C4-dicarboxylate transport system substrate-binding protein